MACRSNYYAFEKKNSDHFYLHLLNAGRNINSFQFLIFTNPVLCPKSMKKYMKKKFFFLYTINYNVDFFFK